MRKTRRRVHLAGRLLSRRAATVSPPPAALEGLWAFAAETDRLTDALVAAALNRESLLDAVELGRVALGVTERGLRRGRALPPATQSIRVGWPRALRALRLARAGALQPLEGRRDDAC